MEKHKSGQCVCTTLIRLAAFPPPLRGKGGVQLIYGGEKYAGLIIIEGDAANWTMSGPAHPTGQKCETTAGPPTQLLRNTSGGGAEERYAH